MAQVRSFLSAKANIATATTDGAVVSAVANQKIRVFGVIAIQGTSVGAITFNSKPAGAGTAISAAFSPAASGGFTLPVGDGPWFTTNAGEGLTVTTGATTTAVGIQVVYDLLPA